MHRFFLPELPGEQFSTSDNNLIHQIRRVFRSKVGDEFIFFSSSSADVVYSLRSISEKQAIFSRKEILPTAPMNKSAMNLTVCQAYPHKIETLELIAQKLVEL